MFVPYRPSFSGGAVKNYQDVLNRTLTEGAFSDWRRGETPLAEGQLVLATLQRNAAGVESYAQSLRRYLADGDSKAAQTAMEAILDHLSTLSDVLCPEATGPINKASQCFYGKGM